MTDRWQKFTEEFINEKQLDELSKYCDEFLIHGVDAEGKSGGMEKELVEILAKWNKIPITYAGGISSIKQIEDSKEYPEEKWISQLVVPWICLVENFHTMK